MIDFSNLEKYRENNRIEAKKALGGLPQSMWETYSSFANTLGGIILLGVEEHKDKTLHAIDLPDPERMVREFNRQLNNPKKTSVNILTDNNVQIQDIDGKHIVVITVPRAQRFDKPVYIDGNPMTGSYRRNGEGDYKCSREEVESMLRDASVQSQDMKILEHMGMDIFDSDSVNSYRQRINRIRPGHGWENADLTTFLINLGAAGEGEDGKIHPTVAGLLMFGAREQILKEFPNYSLEYRQYTKDGHGTQKRIASCTGDCAGNVYEFYFCVCSQIARDVMPFIDIAQADDVYDTAVYKAVCEAVANSLVNADYYGKKGVVVIKKEDMITISNPGSFRIEVESAKSGGMSDPRNSRLVKMFNLIDIGDGSGRGVSSIYSVWKEQGWSLPTIRESFNPDRITLSLVFKPGGNKTGKMVLPRKDLQKAAVIEYLTDNISATTYDIANLLGVKRTKAKRLLSEMIEDQTVVRQGAGQSRIYKLKS